MVEAISLPLLFRILIQSPDRRFTIPDYTHFKNYGQLYISSVTEFEVINGASQANIKFRDQMFVRFTISDFDSAVARQAVKIVHLLKTKRKSIDKPDLFIAATAVVHGLTLDTANKNHFVHIDMLE